MPYAVTPDGTCYDSNDYEWNPGDPAPHRKPLRLHPVSSLEDTRNLETDVNPLLESDDSDSIITCEHCEGHGCDCCAGRGFFEEEESSYLANQARASAAGPQPSRHSAARMQAPSKAVKPAAKKQ